MFVCVCVCVFIYYMYIITCRFIERYRFKSNQSYHFIIYREKEETCNT